MITNAFFLDHFNLSNFVLGKPTVEYWSSKFKSGAHSQMIHREQLVSWRSKPFKFPQFLGSPLGDIINILGPAEVTGQGDTKEFDLNMTSIGSWLGKLSCGRKSIFLVRLKWMILVFLRLIFILYWLLNLRRSASWCWRAYWSGGRWIPCCSWMLDESTKDGALTSFWLRSMALRSEVHQHIFS